MILETGTVNRYELTIQTEWQELNMSKNKIIAAIEAEQMGKVLPEFGPGDTVVVQVKVKEGDRERLQAFEGVVIGRRSRGVGSSFTVRKMSHGVGVERTFQTYSKIVDSVEGFRRIGWHLSLCLCQIGRAHV